MEIRNKETHIRLLDFHSPAMRAFHMTWTAFFLAFFGWFGVAPLMALVRDDLGLTKAQIGNTVIASVLVTIFARFIVGPICDRFGPRRTYAALLVFGAVPVMGIGLANSYESFLLMRLATGIIGASFVITQYHTSVMFAPNCVGTANATAAGWGNLGGGVTQMVMPLIVAALVYFGADAHTGWRLAMVFPGAALVLMGIAYFFFTQDYPDGDIKVVRASSESRESPAKGQGSFLAAARDLRVWGLFVAYGACFGIEITMDNIAALYFHDRFELSLEAAGFLAGLFGLMNLFARALGGVFSDGMARRFGLSGRILLLFATLLLEGIGLVVFASMSTVGAAVVAMLTFALFVKMSNGATYGIVPFIQPKSLGSVAGIVGAGGNVGAVLAGFLFRVEGLTTQQALFWLGIAVIVSSTSVLAVYFLREPRPILEAEESVLAGDAEALAGTS